MLCFVEGDPNNYLTYYKRGTVYLALGKAKNALSDLDRVLELNPDFTLARVTRGNVHLKMGNYDLAQLDFYNVVCICFEVYFLIVYSRIVDKRFLHF